MRRLNKATRLGLRALRLYRGAHGLVGRHDVEKTPITAKLWAIRNKAMLEERKGTGGEERVLDKQPAESRVEITYNLVEDPMLRDLYIDTRGGVLVGKLLEDMDSLAGTVAFIHCSDDDSSTPPPQLVTATSEAINLTIGSLSASQNMVMIGQVGYVGRSSLDIVVEVHRVDKQSKPVALLDKTTPTLLLSSVFRYVARSRSRPGTAHAVNRLVLGPGVSRGEAEFFEQQTAATAARKQASSPSASSSSSASASLGAQDEAAAKEALALGRVATDLPSLSCTNSIHANRTLVENVFLCQPQHQNTSGKVFGGLLMHRFVCSLFLFPPFLHQLVFERESIVHTIEVMRDLPSSPLAFSWSFLSGL